MSPKVEPPAGPVGSAAESTAPEGGGKASSRQKSGDQAPGRGIALMVLSVGFFSVMDALVKELSDSVPTMQIVFFRSLFAFIPLGFIIWRQGLINALRIHDRWGHVLRGVFGVLAMAIFFFAFGRMPLADAIAITFAAPIFVTALSVPLLGEKVGIRRWSAVIVGFLGVLVMVQPGGSGLLDPIAGVMLLGTLFYALAMIMVRRLSRTETNASIVFSFTFAATLVSAAFLPFQWVTPGPETLALLITVGLIGGLAQILMTMAFRAGDVSLIAPFDYTTMLWATLLGFIFWGEIPGNNIWIGVTIVTASGLYILYREANLGLSRGQARRLQSRR
ncbi:MAG: DMT family transporter [Kiloniellales bacterium]|nr:DMT family transporter [Kiloniellales bacterium]